MPYTCPRVCECACERVCLCVCARVHAEILVILMVAELWIVSDHHHFFARSELGAWMSALGEIKPI